MKRLVAADATVTRLNLGFKSTSKPPNEVTNYGLKIYASSCFYGLSSPPPPRNGGSIVGFLFNPPKKRRTLKKGTPIHIHPPSMQAEGKEGNPQGPSLAFMLSGVHDACLFVGTFLWW